MTRKVEIVAKGRARQRIRAVLEEHGFECQAGAADAAGGEEAPRLVVAVAAGKLADATAEELAPLLASNGAVRLTVVCDEVRPGELRAALAAGVRGVVRAGELASALGPCLEAVRTGQVCVPNREARQVEPPALSPREKQVLGLVVLGYMNGQIAARLFLAESTVKSHLSSAFAKLGVTSRNEAVDLILDPARGLGMGILALGGEPVEGEAGERAR
jgi:DNA-binding NarL/FixJ family response regulator